MIGKIPDSGGMDTDIEITKERIREHLLSRASAYAASNGTSLSAISAEAVSDSKFLPEVASGKKQNFTLNTYQRVIDWIDAQERGALA